MKIDMFFEKQEGVLKVRAEGMLDAGLVKEMIIKCVEECRKHNVKKVLIDETNINIVMSGEQIYGLSDEMKVLGYSGDYDIAIVVSKQTAGLDRVKYLEARSRDKNHNVKLFTDGSEAKNWLRAN